MIRGHSSPPAAAAAITTEVWHSPPPHRTTPSQTHPSSALTAAGANTAAGSEMKICSCHAQSPVSLRSKVAGSSVQNLRPSHQHPTSPLHITMPPMCVSCVCYVPVPLHHLSYGISVIVPSPMRSATGCAAGLRSLPATVEASPYKA